jgi:hypothetical protein
MRGFLMLTWVLPRDCWQDRPVTFHRTLWDLVFNNPDQLVWRGVFSKVGVSMRRNEWRMTVGEIAAMAATALGDPKGFYVLEHYVGRVLMQDAANNFRQGLHQLTAKLIGGGQGSSTSKAGQDVTPLFFAPVSDPWQRAMGLDVSQGNAGACSV